LANLLLANSAYSFDNSIPTPRYPYFTAPFPENIPEFVTKTFGKAGKYILDPFLGSGTSIISAVKYGYRGVGIELSKEYAELARRRFAKELPGKKIKIV
jgi:DNA modification methylase